MTIGEWEFALPQLKKKITFVVNSIPKPKKKSSGGGGYNSGADF